MIKLTDKNNVACLHIGETSQNIEHKYNISFAEAKDHTFTAVKTVLIKELEEKQKIVEVWTKKF